MEQGYLLDLNLWPSGFIATSKAVANVKYIRITNFLPPDDSTLKRIAHMFKFDSIHACKCLISMHLHKRYPFIFMFKGPYIHQAVITAARWK
jgi:hypothetical protein